MSSREGPLGSILTAKKNCKKNQLIIEAYGWLADRQTETEREAKFLNRFAKITLN